jgi:hypothetical protein
LKILAWRFSRLPREVWVLGSTVFPEGSGGCFRRVRRGFDL